MQILMVIFEVIVVGLCAILHDLNHKTCYVK